MSVHVSIVIGWKFNHTPGMCTAAGVITAFPISTTDRDGHFIPVLDRDGLVRTALTMPTQAEIDQWTIEYDAWKAVQPAPKTPDQEVAELKAQLAKVQQQIGKAVPAYQPVDLAVQTSATLDSKAEG